MDLTTWLSEELEDMRSRLQGSVLDVVPANRHKDVVDGGGSTVTSLLWHLARHQDVAINAVARGEGQVLDSFGSDVGGDKLEPGDGLAEAESQTLTAGLDSEAVIAYYDAVCAHTAVWLPSLTPARLDEVPNSSGALTEAGVSEAEFPWLHRMWTGKSVAFHVRWEAIAHGVTHTGEMVSMRNRMGLSPF